MARKKRAMCNKIGENCCLNKHKNIKKKKTKKLETKRTVKIILGKESIARCGDTQLFNTTNID